MESGTKKWGFQAKKDMNSTASISVRGVLNRLAESLNKEDKREVIPLAHGDPSAFPCFRTTPVADEAIFDAVRSAKNNHYAPTVGLLPARRAAADYLNRDLPYKLSPDDVFLTLGCIQAIEIAVAVLAAIPGANVLLPRPCFPYYEARAAHSCLDVRHFDLLPEKGWEVDLEAVEALADENTVAMVIINPGNPCGSVYSYQHLEKVAETARKLGIMVISDEVYGHLTFGSTPFVPMGVFASTVPVLTLGSISKRWIVPGWRMGWLVTNDPNGILQDSGVGSLSLSRSRCIDVVFFFKINVDVRANLRVPRLIPRALKLMIMYASSGHHMSNLGFEPETTEKANLLVPSFDH